MGVPVRLEGQAGLPSERSTASYWHREPSRVLLGHRTTKGLPPVADVVIVGSGITGAMAARFLKAGCARDESVVMLEAREACWGATGRNGGHCQPNVYASAPDVAAFEIRTFAFLRDLVGAHGIPCDWHGTTGAHGFFSQPLFAQAAAHLERTRQLDPALGEQARAVWPESESGTDDHSWTTPGRLPDRTPTLKELGVPSAVGAMWQANAAALWPYKLVAWVLEDLIARFAWRGEGSGGAGFNLQTNTPVTHLQRLDPSAASATTPTWMVHTPRGQIAARKVLVATNAYLSNVLPAFSDLVVPVRGQVAALVPPSQGGGKDGGQVGAANPELRHTYVFLAEKQRDGHDMDDYLVQRPRGRRELIFGGGRDYAAEPTVGVWDDGALDDATGAHLRTVLSRVLDVEPTAGGVYGGGSDAGDVAATPGGEEGKMEATYEWTGIMGFSRDGRPWVGAVPESLGGGEGLWVCAGYTGHGMPQAALCAKAVAEMMGGNGGGEPGEVDLPAGFLLSEERARAARTLDEVRVADLKGIGLFAPMEVLGV